MWERSKRLLLVAALVLALVLLPAAPAFAHEARELGHLEMEVGWGTEPAFAGEVNSVQLLLVHDGQPVVDLGDTLDLEVTFGDTTTPMTLEPFFGEGEGTPGDYRAWFIPTSAGRYTFHFCQCKLERRAVADDLLKSTVNKSLLTRCNFV